MAEALGLGVSDLGRAQVQVMGKKLTVVGLLDPETFNGIRDLDDGPLTPVDFELSQSAGSTLQINQSAATTATASQYRPYVHILPDNVLIVPYEIVRQMGGRLRSVAVAFDRERLDTLGRPKRCWKTSC